MLNAAAAVMKIWGADANAQMCLVYGDGDLEAAKDAAWNAVIDAPNLIVKRAALAAYFEIMALISGQDDFRCMQMADAMFAATRADDKLMIAQVKAATANALAGTKAAAVYDHKAHRLALRQQHHINQRRAAALPATW